MTRVKLAIILMLFAGTTAHAADGLITVSSRDGREATLKRLEASVASNGLTIFARIDHAAGAKAAGLDLAPTDLVIFGSPKGGTPLMKMDQKVGIDLPMKALVWQDAGGKTFISYNDPEFLAARHGLGDVSKTIIDKMKGLLAAIARDASGTP